MVALLLAHCCCSGTTWLTKVFWGSFIILSTIVMLNMLIAMMAETYESRKFESKIPAVNLV